MPIDTATDMAIGAGMTGAGMTGTAMGLEPGTLPGVLAAWVVGPVQFESPVWLLGIPILGVITWLIGRKSLAGLGGAVPVDSVYVAVCCDRGAVRGDG